MLNLSAVRFNVILNRRSSSTCRQFLSNAAWKLLSPSHSAVAPLGFAYRRISVKFTPKTRKPSQPKPLPASVKSVGDWIQVKLHECGMAPYHLAAKMGIATSVVNAWKDGLARPQNRQMREMVTILGLFRRSPSDLIAVGLDG
jgi:ribosome-binding protein aMBF1 (putative translation factor)